MGHPVLGASWEGFVAEQIINSLEKGISYSYYRTAEGAECDLVLSRGTEVLVCIEIKFSDAPRTTKSFTTALRDVACNNNYIIIPNCPEAYLLKENVTVCDASWFINNYPR